MYKKKYTLFDRKSIVKLNSKCKYMNKEKEVVLVIKGEIERKYF